MATRNRCILMGNFLLCLLFTACGAGGDVSSNKVSSNVRVGEDRIVGNVAANKDNENSHVDKGRLTTSNAVAKAACMITNVGGKRAVQKSQTFALDFDPFKGSCFVTSYDPQYGDIHMESQYDIYRSGKKIFPFPSQFNGSTFGCWVGDVSFQDLNGDGLTDIIVMGKCESKQADYNENMVYMNDGKIFTTREDANNQLGGFKTFKEITDFVEDNKQIFY